MDESILVSIKKMLGLDAEYDAFDQDVIININSALLPLQQLGVGIKGFHVSGEANVWSDFIDYNYDLQAVKTYVYLRVRLVFDPPSSTAVMQMMQEQIRELEFRLNIEAEREEVVDE